MFRSTYHFKTGVPQAKQQRNMRLTSACAEAPRALLLQMFLQRLEIPFQDAKMHRYTLLRAEVHQTTLEIFLLLHIEVEAPYTASF